MDLMFRSLYNIMQFSDRQKWIHEAVRTVREWEEYFRLLQAPCPRDPWLGGAGRYRVQNQWLHFDRQGCRSHREKLFDDRKWYGAESRWEIGQQILRVSVIEKLETDDTGQRFWRYQHFRIIIDKLHIKVRIECFELNYCYINHNLKQFIINIVLY